MANITQKVKGAMKGAKKGTKKKRIVTQCDIVSRLMQVKGLSSKQLSEKCGISVNHIAKLKGRTHNYSFGMRASTVYAISQALETPPSLLYKAPFIVEEDISVCDMKNLLAEQRS